MAAGHLVAAGHQPGSLPGAGRRVHRHRRHPHPDQGVGGPATSGPTTSRSCSAASRSGHGPRRPGHRAGLPPAPAPRPAVLVVLPRRARRRWPRCCARPAARPARHPPRTSRLPSSASSSSSRYAAHCSTGRAAEGTAAVRVPARPHGIRAGRRRRSTGRRNFLHRRRRRHCRQPPPSGALGQRLGRPADPARPRSTLPAAAVTDAGPARRASRARSRGITPFRHPGQGLLPGRHRAGDPPCRRRRRGSSTIDGDVDQPVLPHLRRAAQDAADRARHHPHLRLQRGRRPLHRARPAGWACASRTCCERAGIQAGVDQILSDSTDGMTISTPVEALTDDRDALVAIAMNGAAAARRARLPGPPGHARPLRVRRRDQVADQAAPPPPTRRTRPTGPSAAGPPTARSRPRPASTPRAASTTDSRRVVHRRGRLGPGTAASRRSRCGSTTASGRRPSSAPTPASTTGASGTCPGTPLPGRHDLTVRATDGTGDVQTETEDRLPSPRAPPAGTASSSSSSRALTSPTRATYTRFLQPWRCKNRV